MGMVSGLPESQEKTRLEYTKLSLAQSSRYVSDGITAHCV